MDYWTDLPKLLADINSSNLTAQQKEHASESCSGDAFSHAKAQTHHPGRLIRGIHHS
jgi:hypothetical protein